MASTGGARGHRYARGPNLSSTADPRTIVAELRSSRRPRPAGHAAGMQLQAPPHMNRLGRVRSQLQLRAAGAAVTAAAAADEWPSAAPKPTYFYAPRLEAGSKCAAAHRCRRPAPA